MGTYRFLLALCVVIEHLSGDAHLTHTGVFAVFGFYVLSGYLITRVLNAVYHFAFIPFWSNRFLRLYPPYFLILLIGLAVVLGTPRAPTFFPEVWSAHPALVDWIGLITIAPMGIAPMRWTFRPVAPIWSVGVELLNYALLYAAVARHKRLALGAAVAAAAFHLVSLWRGDPWGVRYFSFYAALLPFACGALIYFFTRSSNVSLSDRATLLLCVPVLLNGVAAALAGGLQNTPLFTGLFYLNLACQCLAVAGMALRRGPASRLDKRLGDLSYPIFLCHWLVAYVLAMLFFHAESRGIGLMFATLVGATAAAYLVCRLQDWLIEPLRSRVRADALDAPAPHADIAVGGT